MNLDQCEKEGEDELAALKARIAEAPLEVIESFAKAGVDQETFDREWRPRLNAWFAGLIRTAEPPRKKPRQGGVRKSS